MSNVYLPKETVSQKLNRDLLPEYSKLIKKKVEALYGKNEKEFIIQDGPPYANGDLHLGHLLNKSLKDFYVKHKLNQGYKVQFKLGWDCHGLPIEQKALNNLDDRDLHSKCASIALHYSNTQQETLDKLGVFGTDGVYLTMNKDFIDRELDLLSKLPTTEKNKPVWYSPSLNSVLANSEIEYKDITEDSVYAILGSFLIWTTTEWTLKGNQAVCLSPDIQYVQTDNFICSESFALLEDLPFTKLDSKDLPVSYTVEGQSKPVLWSNELVKDERSGIVHLCGGHGEEDFNILESNGIESKNVVDDLTQLAVHINTYSYPFIFKQESITHSYPIDWRTKQKVVKALTPQLYLELDWNKIKKGVKEIKLSGKDRNRLEAMLFSRKDWCISRQRNWGVQIPDRKDILDVWFDSGSVFTMYNNPADLYIEGSDQHRGWFQSSVILAGMVDKIPAKRIFTHGFITKSDNNKLSKSSGAKTVNEYLEQYPPDVLRLWALLSNYKNEVVFSEDSLNYASKTYFKLRNFLRYLINNIHGEKVYNVNHSEVLNINKLKDKMNIHIEEFDIQKALRLLIDYCNNYSKSLTEDIKNKFYESNLEDRKPLESDFYSLYTDLVNILFPYLPFLSIELEEQL